MLIAVLVAGLRSKYGLNSRSAVQVIEDALSTSPETNHPPVAATSPTYRSQAGFAPSFSPEQAQPSPQRHKHAPSQAIVPSGVYKHPTALSADPYTAASTSVYSIPAAVLILFTLDMLPQAAMTMTWTLNILLRLGQASVNA